MARKRDKCFEAYQDKTQKSTLKFDAEYIIEDCIKVWTLQKKRRKMPKPPANTSQENTSKQMVEMVDAGVQVSDQSEKAMAAKVFEEVEKLKEEVELASVALKLTAFPADFIDNDFMDDEYSSDSDVSDDVDGD